MEIIMKNKIITVLLLASAGFGQDAQAMGAARSFAKRVFFSKTAAVAGVLAGTNGAFVYKKNQEIIQEIEKSETTLSQESQEEVKAFFKTHGYSPIIKDYDGACPSVARKGDRSFLLLDRRSRNILNGYGDEILKKKHLLDGVFPHEVDHLKHSDIEERIIAASIAGPLVIIAGKMVRVAGGSKKLTVATGIVGVYSLAFGVKKLAQSHEERCDRNAADTIEHAENLAFYLKEVALSGEKEIHSAITKAVSTSDLPEQKKERLVTFITNYIWMLQDHPRPSKRIADLEKIAAQKKEEEQK